MTIVCISTRGGGVLLHVCPYEYSRTICAKEHPNDGMLNDRSMRVSPSLRQGYE